MYCYMRFSFKYTDNSVKYYLGNYELPFLDHHRDLGIIVSANCTWTHKFVIRPISH